VNSRRPEKLSPSAYRRGVRKIPVILLVLSFLVAGFFPAPLCASEYEALRLFTEALNEIHQKSVSPKNDTELFQGALRGMMSSLDPDCSFLTPQEYAEYQKGSRQAPAEAGLELIFKDHALTVVSVLEGSTAHRAGLKPGDQILKIDGQLVRNLTTQEGNRYFQGPAGKTLKLQVLRNGLVKPLEITLSLAPLPPPQVTSQILKEGYVYLRIPYFSDGLPGDLSKVLSQFTKSTPPIKGMVLDLRNNARGNLEQAVRTASLFLGKEKIVITRGREGADEQVYQGSEREKVVKGPLPLVILVDQGTARAAEILAGALRHHQRAQLLGSKTFGLGGITRVLPLQDGSALVMTVANCYTPGNRKITGVGLEPDVEGQKPADKVGPFTAGDFPPAQDPWVQQALDLLKKGKSGSIARKREAS
jgi:carboxyl-terminal processing protease